MLLVNTEIKEQTIQFKKMTIFPMFLLSKKKHGNAGLEEQEMLPENMI